MRERGERGRDGGLDEEGREGGSEAGGEGDEREEVWVREGGSECGGGERVWRMCERSRQEDQEGKLLK